MLVFEVIKKEAEFNDNFSRTDLIEFLYKHLDRFGDSRAAIEACLDYALSEESGKGGFILAGHEDNQIAAAVVIIKTGMELYIPENFLVYVAVHADHRNQGLGGKIIQKALAAAEGDVALHVEYDNPAKRLYERLGFTTKYAEMRYRGK